jgi:hypothetical protein
MVGWLVCHEFERIWDEVVAVSFQGLSRNFPGGLNESIKSLRMADLWVEISNRDLQKSQYKHSTVIFLALCALYILYFCCIVMCVNQSVR